MFFKKSSNFRVTVLVVIVFCALNVHSQGLGNSPYSALGIGELYSKGFAPNNAIGDAGVSSANGFSINPINPALMVKNKYTTFEVGVLGQYKRLQDLRQSQKDFAGNLGYLALSFPVNDKWSLGLGIRPYSSVDYQQNSYYKIPGTTIYEAQNQYRGQGNLSKVYFANGFQIGKSLYLGAEASYLFGGVNRSASTQVKIGDNRDYTVLREDRISYSDLTVKLGAAWTQELSKDSRLNFGITYDPKLKLTGNQVSTIGLTNATASPITTPDTIKYLSTKIEVPSALRVGLSYERPYNLLVAFDYEAQQWSKYKGLNNANDGFRNSQSYHFGLEYMPKYNSTKYFDLVWYRAGVAYTKTPVVIGSKPIDDLSLSLGLGLPVGRGLSNTINLSVVLGSRGTVSTQTFRERYARIVLGFTLKDLWFQKFKVD